MRLSEPWNPTFYRILALLQTVEKLMLTCEPLRVGPELLGLRLCGLLLGAQLPDGLRLLPVLLGQRLSLQPQVYHKENKLNIQQGRTTLFIAYKESSHKLCYEYKECVYKAGFRIRIRFLRIRIRIQRIRMEANTDPDTDPDPGL
jgi:hypothetical protein